ncbi:MAG: hypothetical protein WC718_15820 [Phycisphaerales bacterium]|jgi:hypothetical protein
MRRRAPKGGVGRFKGGQFVDGATLRVQATQAQADMGALLDTFGTNLQFLRGVYEQNAALLHLTDLKFTPMPLSSVAHQMQAAIRDVYERAFLLGKRAAGNLFGATAQDAAAIRKVRLDEFKWLRRFLTDMREGGGKLDYAVRMDYYRGAARELFWLGWVLADTSPGRRITWHWGDTQDHCSHCWTYDQHGPYTVEAFRKEVLAHGHLPQSGALECRGYNCKCWLTDGYGSPGLLPEKKPQAKPATPAPREREWPVLPETGALVPIGEAGVANVERALDWWYHGSYFNATEVRVAETFLRYGARTKDTGKAAQALRAAAMQGAAIDRTSLLPLVLYLLWLREQRKKEREGA